MGTRRRSRVGAALLLPLLLLASLGTARADWMCAALGGVRTSCCCPGHGHGERGAQGQQGNENGREARLKAQACCTVVQVSVARADAAAPRPSSVEDVSLPARTAVVSPVVLVVPPVVVLRPPTVHAKPPPGGRGVLLSKRSLVV
jgi:hypothetical protein